LLKKQSYNVCIFICYTTIFPSVTSSTACHPSSHRCCAVTVDAIWISDVVALYRKSLAHQSITLSRKIHMQELKWIHVVLSLYWVSAQVLLVELSNSSDTHHSHTSHIVGSFIYTTVRDKFKKHTKLQIKLKLHTNLMIFRKEANI
jgi:hypothetical protein